MITLRTYGYSTSIQSYIDYLDPHCMNYTAQNLSQKWFIGPDLRIAGLTYLWGISAGHKLLK